MLSHKQGEKGVIKKLRINFLRTHNGITRRNFYKRTVKKRGEVKCKFAMDLNFMAFTVAIKSRIRS